MAGTGLSTSRWAPNNRRQGGYQNNARQTSSLPVPKTGDWDCPSCNFRNYASRPSCGQCSRAKFAPINQITASLPTSGQTPGGSNSPPPPYTAVLTHTYPKNVEERLNSSQDGLAISRWAPRNAHLRGPLVAQASNTTRKIWTRTVPVSTSISATSSEPLTLKARDLGLPYEVQHYILTMIERILEEACYEFASRHIPEVLAAEGYTCSEAVELSNWKKILPEHIPLNALATGPSYNLEKSLTHAVRIRNSAQHRHLCDNHELRIMAKQAQDLMFMFSDGIRQSKFLYLHTELEEWDKLSIADQQSAKARLQWVLQQISERPVSDMDWTPNSVSLEEVVGTETISKTATETSNEEETAHFSDEMELD